MRIETLRAGSTISASGRPNRRARKRVLHRCLLALMHDAYQENRDEQQFHGPDGNGNARRPRHYQQYPILTGTEVDRRRRFAGLSRRRAGEELYRARNVSPGIFVLLSGSVRVTGRDGLDRKHVVRARMQPGECSSNIGQLSGKPTLVDVRAINDVETLLLPPRTFACADSEVRRRDRAPGRSRSRRIMRKRAARRAREFPAAQRSPSPDAGQRPRCQGCRVSRASVPKTGRLSAGDLPKWPDAPLPERRPTGVVSEFDTRIRSDACLRRDHRGRRTGGVGDIRICRIGGPVGRRIRRPRARRARTHRKLSWGFRPAFPGRRLPGGRSTRHRNSASISAYRVRPGRCFATPLRSRSNWRMAVALRRVP